MPLQQKKPVKARPGVPKAAKRLSPGFVGNQFGPGRPGGRPPGKTLLTRIKEMLKERSPTGRGTNLDDAAQAFIGQLKQGSYVHAKEIMDREDGKVPTRLADADGQNIKMYQGLPTEGDDAP